MPLAAPPHRRLRYLATGRAASSTVTPSCRWPCRLISGHAILPHVLASGVTRHPAGLAKPHVNTLLVRGDVSPYAALGVVSLTRSLKACALRRSLVAIADPCPRVIASCPHHALDRRRLRVAEALLAAGPVSPLVTLVASGWSPHPCPSNRAGIGQRCQCATNKTLPFPSLFCTRRFVFVNLTEVKPSPPGRW